MKFTTAQVAKVTGFTQNHLKQLIHRDQVRPTYKASGTGDQHSWTLADVYRVGLFKMLMKCGMPAQDASQFALTCPSKHLTPLEFMDGESNPYIFFVLRNDKWQAIFTEIDPAWFLEKGHLMVDLKGEKIPLHAATVVNLDYLKSELDGKINALMS